MASADTYLKRVVIILSVILIVLLAIISISSIIPDGEDDSADSTTDPDPAAAGPYPGQLFEIDDMEFPLTVGCRSEPDENGVFLAFVQNRGEVATSYVVAAELSDANGQSVQAVAEVDDLLPGEQREAVLFPRQDLAGVNGCAITIVQGDRRVLLSR